MKIRKPVVGKMAVTAVIVIVAVGVYAVWGSRRSERVHVREMALAENPGLKGILELYQEDSLKYEAALFLIDNMAYYQGADSGGVGVHVQGIRYIQHGTLHVPAGVGFGGKVVRKAQKRAADTMESGRGHGTRLFGFQYRMGLQGMEGTAVGQKRFVRAIL